MTFSDSYTLPSSLVIQSSIKQPHHQLQSQCRNFDRRMILIIDIVSIGAEQPPKASAVLYLYSYKYCGKGSKPNKLLLYEIV